MSNAAGKETTALSTTAGQKSAVDRLREGFEKLQRNDLAVVQAMNRFADLPTKVEDPERAQIQLLLALPEEEIQKQGWKSKRELRMAFYGTLPKSQWPASMQSAHERVGMRIRKQEKQAPKATFNLNVISIPAAKPAEPSRIITIEAEDKPTF